MKKILVLSLAAWLALPLMAWGPEGHRVIAKIAYAYMNKKTTKQVDKVLGKSGLVFWANWPDEIKSDTIYPHSFDWHFQDMDPGLTDEQVAAMRVSLAGSRQPHKMGWRYSLLLRFL